MGDLLQAMLSAYQTSQATEVIQQIPSIRGNCHNHIFHELAQTHLFYQTQIFRLFKKHILEKHKMLSMTVSQSEDFKICNAYLHHFKSSPDTRIFLFINKGKNKPF